MIPSEPSHVYSVSSLTRELKNLLEDKFRFIRVQGEISNLKRPFSGHSYFTLKDDGAQLRAVLFKGQLRYLEKDIADGQQVVCHGRISVYEPRGDYQIIIDTIEFHGSGLLQLRFEKLKNLLAAEGLFAREKKQAIPSFPKEIVLITSPSGAAVHDFLKVWRKRGFPTDIKIFPVRVQGAAAAEEIAAAMTTVNLKMETADAIVLCRGGGSLEDLWAFNEEILARAIAASRLPVVSAIGHEVDFTISDFCADLRAATPTAAAEQIFPDVAELKKQISHLLEKMAYTTWDRLDNYEKRINQNRRLLGDMRFLFTHGTLRLDHAYESLCARMRKRLETWQAQCEELAFRLHSHSPVAKVLIQEQRLHFASQKLIYLLRQNLDNKKMALGRQAALLDAVSPLATLARGYAIASKLDPETGKPTLLRESRQVEKGDRIEIRLHQGRLECGVVEVIDQN
ncbi:MAG: exodeoxyribonuclease VII large subunit [Proteobacteria bacterium]|nr:exodeoxyribonuclease VII large subunit [Pseudomonadota bacterium]MBU1059505.1 exodeoxyribonuclease VII large subunit [Pseudomonadota bacterium]